MTAVILVVLQVSLCGPLNLSVVNVRVAPPFRQPSVRNIFIIFFVVVNGDAAGTLVRLPLRTGSSPAAFGNTSVSFRRGHGTLALRAADLPTGEFVLDSQLAAT